jgi:hypothetical protein
MSDTWYYVRGDKPIGPISLEDLKRLLRRAKDWREWLVWNASFKEWRNAGLVPELAFPEPPPVPKREPKPDSRPKWWSRLLSILFVLVGAVGVQTSVSNYLHPNVASQVEEVLTLAESKAKVPLKLDEVTTLIAVKHSGPKELTYMYEVNTRDFPAEPKFIIALRKETAPQVCSQMTEALSLGITVWYRYRDSNGSEIGKFGVNQSDCNPFDQFDKDKDEWEDVPNRQ